MVQLFELTSTRDEGAKAADLFNTALPYSNMDYFPAESDILGSEEFVDDIIHRIGDVGKRPRRNSKKADRPFDAEALIASVETVFGLRREKFCGRGKNAQAVMAKEVSILGGRNAGATLSDLSVIVDLDTSTVSRRNDAASQRVNADSKLAYAIDLVEKEYYARIAELQD
jgi:hypothetical protein